MDDIERQFESIAEAYIEYEANGEHDHYQAEVNWPSLFALLPEPPLRVMDYGCGSGVYTRKLLAEGYDVLAVDIAPEMVEELHDLPDYAKVWSYQDESLGEKFDVILAKSVVQFVVDLPRFATAMAEHLDFGGRLIISVPHPNSSRDLLEDETDKVYEVQIGTSGIFVEMIHREVAEYVKTMSEAGLQLAESLEPIDAADSTAPPRQLNLVFERV